MRFCIQDFIGFSFHFTWVVCAFAKIRNRFSHTTCLLHRATHFNMFLFIHLSRFTCYRVFIRAFWFDFCWIENFDVLMNRNAKCGTTPKCWKYHFSLSSNWKSQYIRATCFTKSMQHIQFRNCISKCVIHFSLFKPLSSFRWKCQTFFTIFQMEIHISIFRFQRIRTRFVAVANDHHELDLCWVHFA